MAETDVLSMVKKADESFTETDSLGRVITLRKPGMLAQYRFVEMLGKSADSESYMGMTMPLRFVSAIDDDDKIPCGTKRELEALIQRLGEEGVEAVMRGVGKHFQSTATAEEDKTEIKKPQPTQ
jgi:hypothetical protein